MGTIPDLIVNGTALGCIYALIGIGFVLIYKATGIVNFAQGDLMMVGGFFALTTIGIWHVPYWIGVPVTVLATACFGFLLDISVFRRALGRSEFSVIMLTLGVGSVLRTGAGAIPGWGAQPQRFDTPFEDKVLRMGTLVISEERLAIVVVTLILVTALYLFFRYTAFGVAMQATAQNQIAAHVVGIPVNMVHSMVWALGAGIAALAGVLIAPIIFVSPGMGYVGLNAFPAAVLGGFGSLPGVIVGGLLIGLVEVFSGFYLDEGFKNAAPYVILLIVLFIRPAGLLGASVRKKV